MNPKLMRCVSSSGRIDMAFSVYYSVKDCNKYGLPYLMLRPLEVVVIGEPRCGKTSFIRPYYDDNFPEEIYSQNGVWVYPCASHLKDNFGRIKIFEIPGEPDFNQGQSIPHYEQADAIIFMYAIDDPSSLKMLITKWIPKTISNIIFRDTPVIFVGTKADLQQDQQVIDRLRLKNQTPLTMQQVREVLADFPNMVNIDECSTNDMRSIRRVFSAICYITSSGRSSFG